MSYISRDIHKPLQAGLGRYIYRSEASFCNIFARMLLAGSMPTGQLHAWIRDDVISDMSWLRTSKDRSYHIYQLVHTTVCVGEFLSSFAIHNTEVVSSCYHAQASQPNVRWLLCDFTVLLIKSRVMCGLCPQTSTHPGYWHSVWSSTFNIEGHK